MISADTLQPNPTTLGLSQSAAIESHHTPVPLGTELLDLHRSITRKDLDFSLFGWRQVARNEVDLDHADGTKQAVNYKMKKPLVFRGDDGEITGRMSKDDELVYAFDNQGKLAWIRFTPYDDAKKIYQFRVANGQVEIARFDRETQEIQFDLKLEDLHPTIIGKVTHFNRYLTGRVRFCKTRRGLVIGLAAGGGVLAVGAGAALLLGQKPETTGVIPAPATVPSRATQTSPARSTQPPAKDPEPTATQVDRKDILRNAQEEITLLEKETIGESAFFAQNSAGETIAVNADEPFEAWSLIKVPFTVLILKDIRSNPQKYNLKDPVEINGFVYTSLIPSIDSPFIYSIYEMLRYSNNDVFEYMVKQYAGENDWSAACNIVTQRLQSELDLTSTYYDSELNIFQSTARDLGKALLKIHDGSLSSADKDLIIAALEFQYEWEDGKLREDGSRLAFLRKNNLMPPNVFSFHKIGNGWSGVDGASFHDMGGFVGPEGESIVFVSLNKHQLEDLTPVNEFESQALRITLEVLKNR